VFLYGLTGNLGAGKSTVGGMFRELGFPVVDADVIGHRLLQRPGPVQQQVTQFFPACREETGQLSRARLAEEVFASESRRRQLEQILHPAIWVEVQRQLDAVPAAIGLVEAAVLLESQVQEWKRLAGLVLVVAPRRLRRQRALTRGGVSTVQLEQRLEVQMKQSTKLLAADFLIDNSGTLPATRRQVDGVAKLMLWESGGLS